MHASCGGILCCSISPYPCHDGDVLPKDVGIAVQHLVPEDELAMFSGRFTGDVLLKLAVKMELKVAIIGTSYALQFLTAGGIGLPFVRGALIAAEMDVWEGEDAGKLVDDILCKLYGFGVADIDDIGRDTLPQPHLVRFVGVAAEEFGVCRHRCLGMSGNVHFGYDFHKPFAGVFHHFADIVLGIESSVVLSVGLGVAPSQYLAFAPCPDLGEAGVFLDFDAPSLVFGKVPVEAVHLVGSHDVDDFLHLFFSVEMPAFVEHESPPCKARCIHDVHHRQCPGLRTAGAPCRACGSHGGP